MTVAGGAFDRNVGQVSHRQGKEGDEVLLDNLWRKAVPALTLRGRQKLSGKSRVVIICNDWKTLNRNVAALQDRGHVLVFQPSAAEVHRQAEEDKAARKQQREAVERTAQALDALEDHDARHAEARMAQAAQALERLAEQLPAANQPQAQKQPAATPLPIARGQAPEPATAPQGLPSHEQAKQARELAQQQSELSEAVQQLMSQKAQANPSARGNADAYRGRGSCFPLTSRASGVFRHRPTQSRPGSGTRRLERVLARTALVVLRHDPAVE